jgi:hypothetical protein
LLLCHHLIDVVINRLELFSVWFLCVVLVFCQTVFEDWSRLLDRVVLRPVRLHVLIAQTVVATTQILIRVVMPEELRLNLSVLLNNLYCVFLSKLDRFVFNLVQARAFEDAVGHSLGLVDIVLRLVFLVHDPPDGGVRRLLSLTFSQVALSLAIHSEIIGRHQVQIIYVDLTSEISKD